MQSFCSFPMEIIQEILKQLPHPTLYQCLFVCKALYSPAIHVFYQELNMRAANIELLYRYSFGTPQQSTKYRITNGELVKTLKIHAHSQVRRVGWIIDVQFSPLLQHLPNLRIIDLTSTIKYRAYLKYLYESTTITQESLPHLQKIIVESNTTEFGQEIYFSSCYKFRKSITHLTVYPFHQHYAFNGKKGEYLVFLPEFKNLTHLYVDGGYYTRVQDKHLIIYPVLKACPKLVSLSMKSSCRISEATAQEFLDSAVSGQAAPVSENALSTAINHSQNHVLQPLSSAVFTPTGRYAGLKNIELELPNFPKAYMMYLMSYIHNIQLQTFNLSIEQTTFNIWITENGEDTVMDFAKYLSCISNICINIGRKYYHYYASPPEDMEKLSEYEEAARYWKFVNLIKGSRSMVLTLSLKIHELRRRDPGFEINIQNNRKIELKNEFGTNTNSMKEKNGIDTTSFISRCAPAMELASTNQMYLDIVSDEEKDSCSFNVPQMLEYILFNGTNLAGLVINRFHRYYYPSAVVSARKRLQRESRVAATDGNSLNKLILTGLDLSLPLISIMNGSLCSNIRTLKLYRCKFITDDHQNISLDFAELHHLEEIVIDTELLDLKHRRYVFFKFALVSREGDEHQRIAYYKYEKKATTGGKVTFVQTTGKFISSYNRITSKYTTHVDVKLSASKNISITLLASYYMGYRDDQTETLIRLSDSD